MIHRPSSYSLLDAPTTNDQSNCERKIRYYSKQKAKEAKSRSERRGGKLYVYECPSCGSYHLTSKDPTTTRERRRR